MNAQEVMICHENKMSHWIILFFNFFFIGVIKEQI